MIKE
jgi:hypothetical protein